MQTDKCQYCQTMVIRGDEVKLNGRPIHIGCISLWVKDKEKQLEEDAASKSI